MWDYLQSLAVKVSAFPFKVQGDPRDQRVRRRCSSCSAFSPRFVLSTLGPLHSGASAVEDAFVPADPPGAAKPSRSGATPARRRRHARTRVAVADGHLPWAAAAHARTPPAPTRTSTASACTRSDPAHAELGARSTVFELARPAAEERRGPAARTRPRGGPVE